MIKSISFSQDEILQWITELHAGPIELDPCYGKGNFYKKIAKPALRFDLVPRSPDVIEADLALGLPVASNSISTAIFDPPFLIGGSSASLKHLDNPGSNIIHKQYSSFPSADTLITMYTASLGELHRVLSPGGHLIVKCQDQISSSRQHWCHIWVYNMAVKFGFYPLDLFVLLAKSRLMGRGYPQQHARKFHSYFWVFRKP